jgi:hypothetical protein
VVSTRLAPAAGRAGDQDLRVLMMRSGLLRPPVGFWRSLYGHRGGYGLRGPSVDPLVDVPFRIEVFHPPRFGCPRLAQQHHGRHSNDGNSEHNENNQQQHGAQILGGSDRRGRGMRAAFAYRCRLPLPWAGDTRLPHLPDLRRRASASGSGDQRHHSHKRGERKPPHKLPLPLLIATNLPRRFGRAVNSDVAHEVSRQRCCFPCKAAVARGPAVKRRQDVGSGRSILVNQDDRARGMLRNGV